MKPIERITKLAMTSADYKSVAKHHLAEFVNVQTMPNERGVYGHCLGKDLFYIGQTNRLIVTRTEEHVVQFLQQLAKYVQTGSINRNPYKFVKWLNFIADGKVIDVHHFTSDIEKEIELIDQYKSKYKLVNMTGINHQYYNADDLLIKEEVIEYYSKLRARMGIIEDKRNTYYNTIVSLAENNRKAC